MLIDGLEQPSAPTETLSDMQDRAFLISTAAVFNEERLHTDLAAFGSSLAVSSQSRSDDGTWTWEGAPARDTGTDDSTAVIEFTFGWGDCLAGCFGLHDLRGIIGPDGSAEVFDLGGDPLPAGMMLQPSTQPPP